MDIILYTTGSPNQKVSKSLHNRQLVSNVRFTSDDYLSITHPSVMLNGVTELTDLSRYNYMFIPKLCRYYYIDDIHTRGSQIIIDGKIDVLMSWKDDILKSQQFILRQEKKYHNAYLPDNMLPIRADHNYIMKPFGSAVGNTSSGRILLATTGKGGTPI